MRHSAVPSELYAEAFRLDNARCKEAGLNLSKVASNMDPNYATHTVAFVQD